MISQPVEVRAKRILSRLKGYAAADALAKPVTPSFPLGNWIGRYSNPGGVDTVDVFAEGLSWHGAQAGCVRYSDICNVSLCEGVASRAVTLATVDGVTFVVPVAGGEGKSRDSMEFSRFVSRVVSRDIPMRAAAGRVAAGEAG